MDPLQKLLIAHEDLSTPAQTYAPDKQPPIFSATVAVFLALRQRTTFSSVNVINLLEKGTDFYFPLEGILTLLIYVSLPTTVQGGQSSPKCTDHEFEPQRP